MDFTKFTTKELEQMYQECLFQIVNMKASLETVQKLAAIEKELQSRKN